MPHDCSIWWTGMERAIHTKKEIGGVEEKISLLRMSCSSWIENELATNPTSINYVNDYQQSALHLAVSQPVVLFDIVIALIKAHPDIVKLQNCNGNLANAHPHPL